MFLAKETNLFDSLSSEDEDDHGVKSVVGRSVDDDNPDVAKSVSTAVDTDSSSYSNEDFMTTAKMETHKLTKEIVSRSEDKSEMMIPAETVPDTKTEY